MRSAIICILILLGCFGIEAQTQTEIDEIKKLGTGVLIYETAGDIRRLVLDGTGLTVPSVIYSAESQEYKDAPWPMLSSDGTHVYFRKCPTPQTCDLWRMKTDGTDIQKFSNGPYPFMSDLRISSAGPLRIAFTANDSLINNGSACRGSDTWWQTPVVYTLDSTLKVTKISDGGSRLAETAECRDQVDIAGTLVTYRIYAHSASIYVYNSTNGIQTRVTNGGSPAISPDMTRLLIKVSGGYSIFEFTDTKWTRTQTTVDPVGRKYKWTNLDEWLLLEGKQDEVAAMYAHNYVSGKTIRLTFDGSAGRGGLYLDAPIRVLHKYLPLKSQDHRSDAGLYDLFGRSLQARERSDRSKRYTFSGISVAISATDGRAVLINNQ